MQNATASLNARSTAIWTESSAIPVSKITNISRTNMNVITHHPSLSLPFAKSRWKIEQCRLNAATRKLWKSSARRGEDRKTNCKFRPKSFRLNFRRKFFSTNLVLFFGQKKFSIKLIFDEKIDADQGFFPIFSGFKPEFPMANSFRSDFAGISFRSEFPIFFLSNVEPWCRF